MKRKYICLLFCFVSYLAICAQEKFSKFDFSGYRVVIIPEDSFRVNIVNDFDAIREITKDGVLRYAVKDQTGQVPKDTIYVYTNNIDYLKLHNVELVMKKSSNCDSLNVILECAFGELNVHANFLNINATAGSRLVAKGTNYFLNCSVGAGSHVDAAKLKVEQAKIDVMGYSSLSINSRKILNEEVNKNSSFKNVHKKD